MFPTSFAQLLLRLTKLNESWLDFASQYECLHFNRGQLLPLSHDNFYLIKKGAVRTSCIMPSGLEWIWIYQKEGCLVHEVEPRLGLSMLYTSLTPVEMYVLPAQLLQSAEFYKTHPLLAINYLETLAFKEAICHSYCYDLAAATSTGRVCQALLALAREQDQESEFAPKLSQTEIGSMMGLHPTSVARSVSTLRDNGVIGAFTKNKLEIFSYKKLADFAAEYSTPSRKEAFEENVN